MTTESSTEKAARVGGGGVDSLRAAAEYGIDIGQLRDNLALSVAERLRRHQIALNAVELLQRARRR